MSSFLYFKGCISVKLCNFLNSQTCSNSSLMIIYPNLLGFVFCNDSRPSNNVAVLTLKDLVKNIVIFDFVFKSKHS